MTRGYLLNKIGAAPPEPRLVVQDQDANDIIQGIRNKHTACQPYYDKIAEDFYSTYLVTTCRRLWQFCRENLQYHEESINKQYASSPQTILQRGYSDCKGYALFCGGVLDAINRKYDQNISWCYRFASDNQRDLIPGHVFIVVNTSQGEIWLDPVLPTFNQDHTFYSKKDIYTRGVARVAGCDCNQAVGAITTTAGYGQAIIKIAPLLATVPVVGWVAGAAAEVVGGIIAIVGSKWAQSPDVRWLIQLYEYYAKGNAAATSDNKVNEADAQNAQAFFSIVLGVPIGGRKDFNILQSGDGNTNTPTSQTAAQRANNYLAWKGLTGQLDINTVIQAATIAATLNPNGKAAGSWAGLTAAPSTIDKTQTEPTMYVDQNGQLTNATGAPIGSSVTGNPKIILLAAAAAVAIILFVK